MSDDSVLQTSIKLTYKHDGTHLDMDIDVDIKGELTEKDIKIIIGNLNFKLLGYIKS